MKKKSSIKKHPYINAGGTTVLEKSEILGIFDLDNSSTKTDTKRYLASMEHAKHLEMVGNDIPKAFIVTAKDEKREKVYMTTLSSASLYGRWKRQSKYL